MYTVSYSKDGGSIDAIITCKTKAAAEKSYADFCAMVDADSPAFPKPTAKIGRNGKLIGWYTA